jgi:Domain of unknown function (DUF4372)
MAFAQLTYRESLRDIETFLRSLGGKLYHIANTRPGRLDGEFWLKLSGFLVGFVCVATKFPQVGCSLRTLR